MAKTKSVFPAFAIAVLVVCVLWILSETGILTIKIPWFPLVIGIIALGWIIDFYQKKK